MSSLTADNPEFWRERYLDHNTPWDLDGPAPPFRALLDAKQLPLTEGTLMVPGCGLGHDAALFGQSGYQVTGLDLAPEAIALATARYGQWAEFRTGDFFGNNIAPNHVDGIVEHTLFCAIPPKQRNLYVTTVLRLLKPGGWLVALFWDHGKMGGPPYTVDELEIRRRFEPGFHLTYLSKTPDSTPDRAGQEWLGLFQKR